MLNRTFKFSLILGLLTVCLSSCSPETQQMWKEVIVESARDSIRYHYGTPQSVSDVSWDWDYLSNGQWRCRGIQTGQFSDDEYCANEFVDDDRWPNYQSKLHITLSWSTHHQPCTQLPGTSWACYNIANTTAKKTMSMMSSIISRVSPQGERLML